MILIILGSLIGLSNWVSAITALGNKGNTSFVLFIGGVLCGLGFIINPSLSISYFWWVGIIIDFTFLPMITLYIFQKLKHKSNGI